MTGTARQLALAILAPYFAARQWLARRLVRMRAVQEAFLEFLGNRDTQLLVDLGDHSIQCFPGDSIGRGVFFKGEWQRDLLAQAIGLLSERHALALDSVFIDVGANIGTQSVYAHLSKKFSQVVSIEPEPANFKVLKANLARNGMPEHLAFNLGAGEAPSHLRLYLNANSSGKHSFQRQGEDSIDVPVDTIEGVLQRAQIAPNNVSLVWIDVEGFEPQVLRGMPSLLARKCPIVLEFTPRFYGPDGTRDFVSQIAEHYSSFITFENCRIEEKPVSSLAAVTVQTDILLGFNR